MWVNRGLDSILQPIVCQPVKEKEKSAKHRLRLTFCRSLLLHRPTWHKEGIKKEFTQESTTFWRAYQRASFSDYSHKSGQILSLRGVVSNILDYDIIVNMSVY